MKSKIKGDRKYLALWVNFYVEEDNDIIGWYDHDYEESYSVDDTVSIEVIVNKMLVQDGMKSEIKKSLDSLGVTSIEHVFMLMRHTYDEKPGELKLSDSQLKKMNLQNKELVPVFVGNFEY